MNFDADILSEFVTIWNEASEVLVTVIKEVECQIRLMVPAIIEHLKISQRGYVARVLKKPVTAKTIKDETLTQQETEDLVGIFVDANRLRKSVITSIVRAMTVHQATFFLEALCHIRGWLKDQVCKEDEEDCTKLLVCNFLSGVIAVPAYFLVMSNMTESQKNIAICTFAAAVLGSAVSTFDSCIIKDKSRKKSIQDAVLAMASFFLGGILPVAAGLLIPSRGMKICVMFVLTTILIASVVVFDYKRKPDPKKKTNAWILGIVTVFAISSSVGFSDIVSHLRA